MSDDQNKKGFRFSRRQFLNSLPPALAGMAAAWYLPGDLRFRYLEPIDPGLNPLDAYPNRGWEKVYRDLYTPDSSFTYLCAPNDTHGCLLKANVKNGVVVYADPSFGYGKATDLYGNAASSRWDPRVCISGLAYVRRFYSDRRLKGVFVRKGFKAWADEGFPRDSETGQPPKKYVEGRGKEDFIKMGWDEAFTLVAKALTNIVGTYSGEAGKARLTRQNYDPAMVETMGLAGTRTVKCRGGMPLIPPLRIGGAYRFSNMLALLDAYVRKVEPKDAKGAKGWDNYAWHTDLPPGHTMVSGQQTLDFNLYTAENAKVITLWGMNWIATKMPDGHWLTEAKLHGARVVTIAPEYQSTSSKGDDVIVIRPGTDGALALGLAGVIIQEKLYDEAYVKSSTDLPLLVRMDSLKLLQAQDVVADYKPSDLSNFAKATQPTDTLPAPALQDSQYIPEAMRNDWSDNLLWDRKTNSPKVVNRNQVGKFFAGVGVDPALEGEFEVTLLSGQKVKVRPSFDLLKQYISDTCSVETVSKVTWVPAKAITDLARLIAANKSSTLFAVGMGPNQFFNSDIKDRTILLVAGLTNNIGHFGGTVGSFSGNYRVALFSGIGQYLTEDPFDIELDPAKMARTKSYWAAESAHYFDYDDRPLRVGNKLFTGKTHMPTPTKACFWAMTNSILGNAKWAHNVMVNTLPKIEMIAVADWFWTATCEYADVVMAADSWVERRVPDVYGSVTNPFLQSWPRSPLPRIFDTKDDIECWAGIAAKLAEITGDKRFRDYWQFVHDNKVEAYINRIFRSGNATKGYTYEALEASCQKGVPFYLMTRTSPRVVGWEQTNEGRPWYTKSGRLEFYRDEDEFIEYGENLPVWREPSDGTPHEPNVIMARPHPAIRPKEPQAYGLDAANVDAEVRQVRNVVRTPEELVNSRHPLDAQGFTHILITPKYRHAGHSMASSTDLDVVFFGPFGDFYRHDKRKPWVSEGYIDINPQDAKELGIEDGDYIYCDADPSDRPFVGSKDKPADLKTFRWLVRARYNPSVAPGVGRSWFHFYVSTHGSVEGHETRKDGLAKNPRTNYQAAYRYGSHQSVTRAWLRPTLMTDSLVRKENYGQVIGKGFAYDVYGVVGAPRESFVKMAKAEDGGEDTTGLWTPAARGYRPTYESEAVKRYLAGDFIEREG